MSRVDRTAAGRQRLVRWRRARGLVCLRIEADEHGIAEALIASGRLGEADALSRPAVERELGRLVADWASRWKNRCA